MTRDPVDAAEIEHDLAQSRLIDLAFICERILDECECGENLDWIEKEWAHELLAEIAWFLTAPGHKIMTAAGYSPLNNMLPPIELLALRNQEIHKRMHKYMQDYAQKRAERERDPS